MNPCLLCDALTSSVPLSAKEGLDFSYIALNNNCAEEDLRITAQNRDHIFPLIQQTEEYESAISTLVNTAVKGNEENETAVAFAHYQREAVQLTSHIQRKGDILQCNNYFRNRKAYNQGIVEEILDAAIRERDRLLNQVKKETFVMDCIATKKRALAEVKEARLALYQVFKPTMLFWGQLMHIFLLFWLQELKRRRFAQAKKCFESVKFLCDENRCDANLPITGVSSIMNMSLPNNGYFEGTNQIHYFVH